MYKATFSTKLPPIRNTERKICNKKLKNTPLLRIVSYRDIFGDVTPNISFVGVWFASECFSSYNFTNISLQDSKRTVPTETGVFIFFLLSTTFIKYP